jgi:hypothetical protein
MPRYGVVVQLSIRSPTTIISVHLELRKWLASLRSLRLPPVPRLFTLSGRSGLLLPPTPKRQRDIANQVVNQGPGDASPLRPAHLC